MDVSLVVTAIRADGGREILTLPGWLLGEWRPAGELGVERRPKASIILALGP